MNSDIVIIGAGLAGLTAAIHLLKIGFEVTVIEKNSFPRHKVCGEYISNEVLPYLNWLNINPKEINAIEISDLLFSTSDGRAIKTKLPLGGFGISRFTLDYYLYRKAIAAGCNFIQQSVIDVNFVNDEFEISLADNQIVKSKVTLGAFGKRSNIDIKMQRDFIGRKSPWLAVKSHFKGEIDEDLVGLHNFDGGYCGVSMVEDNKINICYLANFESFKKYKNVKDFQQNVLSKNPHLNKVLKFESLFETPLTISQISFDKKKSVENHILMIGDTAGLIHPLCGNGMAMAIHSAKLAVECVQRFVQPKFHDRQLFESEYAQLYKQNFDSRLRIGRYLGALMRNEAVAKVLLSSAIQVPSIVPMIIKQTHGNPIQPSK